MSEQTRKRNALSIIMQPRPQEVNADVSPNDTQLMVSTSSYRVSNRCKRMCLVHVWAHTYPH